MNKKQTQKLKEERQIWGQYYKTESDNDANLVNQNASSVGTKFFNSRALLRRSS